MLSMDRWCGLYPVTPPPLVQHLLFLWSPTNEDRKVRDDVQEMCSRLLDIAMEEGLSFRFLPSTQVDENNRSRGRARKARRLTYVSCPPPARVTNPAGSPSQLRPFRSSCSTHEASATGIVRFGGRKEGGLLSSLIPRSTKRVPRGRPLTSLASPKRCVLR